jgi:hypothetical protein
MFNNVFIVDFSEMYSNEEITIEIFKFIVLPRSNMHDRKRPFTENNRDIQRSWTGFVYDACTRSDTVGNGFCIRRSYKNAKWLKGKHLYSVYGRSRLSQLYNLINSKYFNLFNLIYFRSSRWIRSMNCKYFYLILVVVVISIQQFNQQWVFLFYFISDHRDRLN